MQIQSQVQFSGLVKLALATCQFGAYSGAHFGARIYGENIKITENGSHREIASQTNLLNQIVSAIEFLQLWI